MIMSFHFSPDYRKEPPSNGLYCCNCQRPLNGKFISVSINYETMQVKEDINGKDKIGVDCWRKIIKSPVYER